MFSNVYRLYFSWLDNLSSYVLILHYRIIYPSLKIDFHTYIGKGATIICCDGAICKIKNTHIAKGVYIKVELNATLKIVEAYIGADSMIVANHHIVIGSHCSVGEMVVIRDQNHTYGSGRLIKNSGYEVGKIVLHENVWVGAKATILKGVEIGKNSVVGAHSLVNKSFPPESIVVGIPAGRINQ